MTFWVNMLWVFFSPDQDGRHEHGRDRRAERDGVVPADPVVGQLQPAQHGPDHRQNVPGPVPGQLLPLQYRLLAGLHYHGTRMIVTDRD